MTVLITMQGLSSNISNLASPSGGSTRRSGVRGVPTAEVIFDDVIVPSEQRLTQARCGLHRPHGSTKYDRDQVLPPVHLG